MIKRITTFLLLMALFAPWAANAQETLTVHDGTTTNSFVPIYGYYADAYLKCEMVYPASELGDMGAGVITGMRFYASQSSVTWGSANFQVFLTEVGSTTISAFAGSGTTVYSGALSIVNGEMNVSFTTPYEYGGGNLLVGVYNTTEGDFETSSWFGETITGASYQGYSYSSLSSISGAQRNFLPKTTFTYTPGSNYCASPSNVLVSNETATGATISWTGDNDSYLVVVSEGAQEPYSYDFEDGTQGWTILKGNTGDSPNNWHHNTTHVSYDGSSGELQDWATFGHNSSSGFMLSESYISATSSGGTAYGAVTPDNYLVSPQVPLGGSISFYAGAKNTSYCAEKFSVMVSTTGNTNTASFTTVQTWTLSLSSAGYTSLPYTVDLSAYAGQTGYIAIRHWDCYDQWVLCIDDITISNGDSSSGSMTYSATASPFTLNDPEHINPGTTYSVQVIGICGDQESRPSAAISFTTGVTCPAPTGLSVSDLTAHGAKVSWTKMATQETGDITYQFTWVEAGGTPNWTDAAWAYDRWNNPDQVPHAFANDLDPETAYDFYVRRDCGDGVYSAPVMVRFTTAIACPVPTNVSISNITGHEATVTWTGNSESNSYNVFLGIDTAPIMQNVDFSSGIPSNWNNDATYPWTVVDGYIKSSNAGVASSSSTISVTLTFPADGTVEFDAQCRGEGSSTYYDHCDFYIDSDRKLYAGANIDGWNHYSFNVTEGQHTFKWSYTKDDIVNPTGDYFAIDNVVMMLPPNIVWNDPISVENTEYIISGLTSEATYYVSVQGDCGDEGMSSMSTPVAFTTTVTCPAPTDVTVSNITGHGATVTWTGISESYNVRYREAGGFIPLFSEDFENNIDDWTLRNCDASTGIITDDSYDGNAAFSFYYTTTPPQYLISPVITGVAANTKLEFYYKNSYDYYSETFQVGFSSTNNETSSFTFGTEITASDGEWHLYSQTIPAGTKYICWKCTSDDQWSLCIDEIVVGTEATGGEWQTVTTEETTITLTGLTSETYYEVVVQGDCGEEGLSAESDHMYFTTDITCPAPTDLNVVNITGRVATINWTGTSESYIVMIGAEHLVSNVDFETGDLSQDEFTTTASYPWTVVENTHSGAYCAKSGNGFTSTNSDLSLTVTLTNAATVSFWAKVSSEVGYDYGRFLIDDAQKMQVSGTSNDWTYYSYELSAGTHTLVWRFYKDSIDYDEIGDDCFYVDDIVIKGGATSWTEYTTTETTYTFEGLTSSTSYQVKVQGDCGEEGMSAVSAPITFITDVTCPAPTGLTATNITSNSAVLNWTSDAGSYNVSYFKAYFFDSFEEDLSQWTIYKEGDDESWEWGIENPHDNSSDLSAHSGDFAVVAYSDEEVHADSWLVSPQILFPNQTTLKFWIMRSTYDEAKDEYEVLLSTTGNAISDFTTVLKEKEAANSTWTEVSIDLSEYDGQQGYIAIRHDYTGGFFLMVDDFGIYGWSEEITTTENSLLIEDLLPETEYLWHVQANCGDEDGMSQWSNTGRFTTLTSCPIPFDLNVTQITANGATIAWTGYNDNYEVWVGQPAIIPIHYDFEDNNISADFTNSSTSPWTVTTDDKHAGTYSVKSGGAGLANAISDLILEVTLAHDATLSFWARISSESGYDEGYFSINDSIQSNLNGISGNGSWIRYSYTLEAGTHTLHWYYTKDSSMNANDDCFYVDDITIESDVILSEMTYTATESPFILVDATNIHPETTYLVKVKGFCDDFATEYSEGIAFTTLDESTKIFVIEGDWSDGSNWVPAGVPTIEENVILRAEATVFDVAEANIITIENDVTLTIEDGGQLKTNTDVEATMKRFIIGYGTDYVETNYGYYLMALPTAAPISATDAGLITEESDYDLYGWDRTATDEEWQNNHDGIDLQNGVGYLYSNRDDMEMSFTATLRNSSEPITLTAEYDDVEHGGWNLFGNPFPCEVYITTDAEGMTFYRLVDNELVPVEGAIAPLEGFFVKATAAGQTFTISREAPAK